MDIMLIIAGALTGFLIGLVGVGGGALMTPILLLIFGIAPSVAVGTDLWFAALTKMVATKVHNKKQGTIDWQVVRRLWAGSLTTALITIIYLKYNPITGDAIPMMKTIIGIVVIITALSMIFQKKLHSFGRNFRVTDGDHFKALQMPMTVFAGAVIGFLVAYTSIGAGTLGAVFILYLYPLRMVKTQRLVATDLVHAIPLALFAGMGHLGIGNVDFPLLFNLLVGSIPAVWVGATVSSKLPHKTLQIILSVVLIIIGYQLLTSTGVSH